MTAGDIYTIAGNGSYGFSGDGGPAQSATLASPSAVAVDAGGNVFIGDEGNLLVRELAATTTPTMTAGAIYTIAGNGLALHSGDGGSPTAAEVSSPTGVPIHRAGNLFLAGDSTVPEL